MTTTNRIKSELNKLKQWQVVNQLSKQLGSQIAVYEKKIRKLAKEVEAQGRDARSKGQKEIEKWTSQARTTLKNLEKKGRNLISEEGDRLNESLTEVFKYLKTVSKSEKLAQMKEGSPQSTQKKSRVRSTSKSTKKSSGPGAGGKAKRASSTTH